MESVLIRDRCFLLAPVFTLVSCSAYSSTLKMEKTRPPETSVYFKSATRRYIIQYIAFNMTISLTHGLNTEVTSSAHQPIRTLFKEGPVTIFSVANGLAYKIDTERPPLVGDVCGKRVPRGQSDVSPKAVFSVF
jgi:hypothetical protein